MEGFIGIIAIAFISWLGWAAITDGGTHSKQARQRKIDEAKDTAKGAGKALLWFYVAFFAIAAFVGILATISKSIN